MFDRFRHRSYELERLDTGEYTAAEYEEMLIELQRVNRWLGDARALRHCLLREVTDLDSASVLDVGAGSGELLRLVAGTVPATNTARLVGLELNRRSARAIHECSAQFPSIAAVQGSAFELPFGDGAFDFTFCSLFAHHFGENDLKTILREMRRVTRDRVFVIDLHRHPIAYYFYITVARLFLHNSLVRADGALSILRSFKPRELLRLAKEANLTNVSVARHFPYRLVLEFSGATVERSAGETNQAQPADLMSRGRAA